MRIIKSNTATYESFHKSLPYLTKTGSDDTLVELPSSKPTTGASGSKYVNILKNMLLFEKHVKDSKNFQQVVSHFNTFLKVVLTFKEANLFLFDEHKSNLIALSQYASERSKYFVNKAYSEGQLDDIFKSGEPIIMLDHLVHDIDGSKSFYLLIPILEENKGKWIFSILTPTSSFSENSLEVPFIQMGLTIILSKIEILLKQKELKSIYNELHVYQSKLANDYKLSAIGELTSGIVEDILTPLQVITSTTELLRSEGNYVDEELLYSINVQVKKVKNIINRLVNFAGITDGKLKVQPCSINGIINDFYQVTITSLQNDNYECVLDLEDNLPSVLSHPNYINQLLSYIFSLLKSQKSVGGGMLIQTKYHNERVNIKILSTDYLENIGNENTENANDVNLRIIKNIMEKHEGLFRFETDKINGTVVHLIFPLKRKINQ